MAIRHTYIHFQGQYPTKACVCIVHVDQGLSRVVCWPEVEDLCPFRSPGVLTESSSRYSTRESLVPRDREAWLPVHTTAMNDTGDAHDRHPYDDDGNYPPC